LKRLSILLLAAALLAAGCGYYSTSSRDRSLKGSLYMPILGNSTSQAGLELEITELIIEAIERDALLAIIPDENEADFRLQGIITRYDERASFTGSSGGAEEYHLQLTVQMDFKVLRPESLEVVPKDWSKNLNSQASFYLEDTDAGEALTREEAEEEVRRQLVEDTLNAIFGDW